MSINKSFTSLLARALLSIFILASLPTKEVPNESLAFAPLENRHFLHRHHNRELSLKPWGKFFTPGRRFRKTTTDSQRNDSTNEDNLTSFKKQTKALSVGMPFTRGNALLALIGGGYLTLASCDPAEAITREYPSELTYGDTGVYNRRKMAEEKVKNARAQTISKSKEDPLKTRDKEDFLTTIVWSGALWLGLGSRSNFLVRPLANLLYDSSVVDSEPVNTVLTSNTNAKESGEEINNQTGRLTEASAKIDDPGVASSTQLAPKKDDETAFVRDRNEGYFSELPPGLTFILAAVFIASGWALNRIMTLFVLSGDSDLNLQLAGVTLIAGAFLELGRVASGEKQPTREEADRAMILSEEFQQFAFDRLLVQKGGNVHRSEVCASFRRYYAKYRYPGDSGANSISDGMQDNNVTDLEIERLMRSWNRQFGSGEEMSRAGFFTGVQLNKAADITITEALVQ